MSPLPTTLGRPSPAWRELLGSRLVMGGGYALAALLTAASVVLGSSPTLVGPLGPASPLVLGFMAVGFVLLAALAAMLGFRVLRLIGARRSDPGAQLHLRFVTLFGLAAVAPAVIVALFFGVLVTRGVDAWFGARVQSVVENSATVARSYVEEQTTSIGDHVASMAVALNTAAPELEAIACRLQPVPARSGRRQRVFRRLCHRRPRPGPGPGRLAGRP